MQPDSPRIPPREVRIVVAEAAASLLAELNSPAHLEARLVREALERGAEPEPEHVDAVATALAHAWAEATLRGERLRGPSRDALREISGEFEGVFVQRERKEA